MKARVRSERTVVSRSISRMSFELSKDKLGQIAKVAIVFLIAVIASSATPAPTRANDLNKTVLKPAQDIKPAQDRRDDLSPWGVASGAEWFSAYPLFNPLLKDAGVRWLRGFYEWQTIQPKEGYWNWTLTDRLVENTRRNGIRLTAGFAYFAPWASADGGTRRFPIKNIQFWRDYVSGLVGRYRDDIKYWEVWNEFNGSFAENGTPRMYAELVREASIAAKKIDPSAKIGMSVANFDVGFLDTVIKEGAAGHFDYICVHPYEKLNGLLDDGEIEFLSMTASLKQMLAKNGQPLSTPLWITELGAQSPVRESPAADLVQAVLLVKAYILSIASGFERVFWFEARGPTYGNNSDHGLIRSDMSPRPSYGALKAMTEVIGAEPAYLGWLNLGNGGYGFVFEANGKNTLAAWAPSKRDIGVTFGGDVRVVQLNGAAAALSAGQTLTLTNTPLYITELPSDFVEQARANKDRPFPWRENYAQASIVKAQLKVANIERGVRQVNSGTTLPVIVGDESWRRTDFAKQGGEGHYVYFLVDPQFVHFGTNELEITAVVRRISPDRVSGMSLNYESRNGYINGAYFNVPGDDRWHELKWKIKDANFVGGWGWNFRLDGIASPNDFLIREVRVEKAAPR